MTHVAAQARVPQKGLLIFLVGAAALLLLGLASVISGLVRDSNSVEIVTVVDGNTVVVNDHGSQETVKMAGVVSSIRNPQGLTVGPEYCLGEDSYTWLRDRLPQGATVTMHTSSEGAPEGMDSARFAVGGDDINALMAEEGMAAPTGLGVGGDDEQAILDGNAVARASNVGLYSEEEDCTINFELYEATYALDQLSTTASPTVAAIDAKFTEYSAALNEVRLVQEEIAGLDPESDAFKDLAYAPAKEELQATADARVEEGLQVLRDLNEQRNAITAQG